MKKLMNGPRRALFVAGLLGAMLITYQNCAPEGLSNSGVASLASTDGNGTYTENGDKMEELPDLKPVGVDYSENTMITMLTQAGVTTPSTQTAATYRASVTMIPESGRAGSVTAPMWIAFTTLSSEVCQDLLTQEKALVAGSRRFFGMVDFTRGPATVTDAVRADVIRRLARNFWSRNETESEKQMILDSVKDAFAAQTAVAQTEYQMLFICSGMLASLDARKQ